MFQPQAITKGNLIRMVHHRQQARNFAAFAARFVGLLTDQAGHAARLFAVAVAAAKPGAAFAVQSAQLTRQEHQVGDRQ